MSSYRGSGRAGVEQKPQIFSWSFSRLKTYKQCPLKAKFAYVDKLEEPESEAMLEGKRIHELAEHYLKGDILTVPKELSLLADDYRGLREHGRENPGTLFAELGLAFDADLREVEWFSKQAWLRCKFDALVLNDDGTAFVNDLKTGKQRREDKDQLSLFSFAIMLKYPEVEEVSVENWYSTSGNILPAKHLRKNFDALKEHWLQEADPMLRDTEFLPLPNALCGWCHYRKSNGGPCPLNK